jgi:uncharacterized membrane protein YphA (DoxX/SURF4 family)
MLVVALVRISIAAVFLMAGWLKASDTNQLVQTVEKFRILPGVLVKPFARMLPWAELSVAILLFAGVATQFAAAAALSLLTCFFVASLLAVMRHLDVSCDCFGVLYHEPIGRKTLFRDFTLVSGTAVVVGLDTGELGLWSLFSRGISGAEAVISILTIAVLVAACRIGYRATGRKPFARAARVITSISQLSDTENPHRSLDIHGSP